VEEAPSPIVTPSLREEFGRAAIRIASAAEYTNAGTVEFILDKKNKFYFIEANARIQVEHPVTEMITGIDLIKEQIRIASGEKIGYKQKSIKFQGAAIECRINAEDAENGFKPSAGKITFYNAPGGGGVRVDSHVHSNYVISPHYDSLIGKLIVHGPSRQEAISRMKRALDEYTIEGIKTTIPFFKNVFGNERFLNGKVDTAFIEKEYGD
jgi:acetyl-CoA carboxylase biotin carboxylase subunit